MTLEFSVQIKQKSTCVHLCRTHQKVEFLSKIQNNSCKHLMGGQQDFFGDPLS